MNGLDSSGSGHVSMWDSLRVSQTLGIVDYVLTGQNFGEGSAICSYEDKSC